MLNTTKEINLSRRMLNQIKKYFKLDFIKLANSDDRKKDKNAVALGFKSASSLDGTWQDPNKEYFLVITNNGKHRKMNFKTNYITLREKQKINEIINEKTAERPRSK